MLKSRDVEFDLEGLIVADKQRRDFILKTDDLRKKKNQVALEISQKKKKGEDATKILDEMKNLSKELSQLESSQEQVEKNYMKLALTIPNLIDKSVPIGNDDSANKEIKKWGEIPKFDFKINDH